MPVAPMKTCRACGETKPRSEFRTMAQSTQKSPFGTVYVDSHCKVCRAAQKRDAYHSNKGGKRWYHIAHAQNRRAKSLGLPGTLTPDDIATLHTQPACHWCGYPNDGTIAMHVDHFIPVSEGGHNTPENLVLACQVCNLGRQKLSHEQMRMWLDRLRVPPLSLAGD